MRSFVGRWRYFPHFTAKVSGTLDVKFNSVIDAFNSTAILVFLPRCMQCRRGLAMRKLPVCLSVCQTRGL